MTVVKNTEIKKPGRGWVKNAIIIFLLIMLVLTFFSNTLMNYSLPQVAVQYPSSGQISSQIRATGSVKANEDYSVSIEEARTIEKVEVKRGDKVEKGQTLFTLVAVENDDVMKEAEDKLNELQLAYDRAVLTAQQAEPDYTSDTLTITRAKEKLDDLKAERALLTDDADLLNNPLQAKKDAEDRLKQVEEEIASLEKQIENLGGSENQDIDTLKKNFAEAVINYCITFNHNVIDSNGNTIFPAGLSAKERFERAEEYYLRDCIPTQDYYLSQGTLTDEEKNELTVLRELEKQYNEYTSATPDAVVTYIENEVQTLKDEKAELENIISIAPQIVTLDDSIKSQEQQIEDLQTALSKKKESDEISQELSQLDLDQQLKAIEAQKEVIEKLKSSPSSNEIVAPIAGTISALNVVAGNKTAANDILATIEVTEKGYYSEVSISSEQAQKVRVGDSASVTNWWYGNITASVASIRTDPSSQGQKKLVTINLTGDDLSVGQSLDFAIGSRNMSYDVLVPKTAIREDNNGKFVLTVSSKSSPIGTRYYAVRTDVTVLASDDTYYAVSGLDSYEYIITTSTKPISAGEQVRLADNN